MEQRFNKESDVVLDLIKGSVRDFNFRADVHQLQLSKCRLLNVREVEKKVPLLLRKSETILPKLLQKVRRDPRAQNGSTRMIREAGGKKLKSW